MLKIYDEETADHYVQLAWDEMGQAWARCTKAVVRADKKGNVHIHIQPCRNFPGYRLMSVGLIRTSNRYCYRFRGMRLLYWASNLMYALSEEGHFEHACNDQIDKSVNAKLTEEERCQ